MKEVGPDTRHSLCVGSCAFLKREKGGRRNLGIARGLTNFPVPSLPQGTAINKSLLTLGNVINKLAEGAQATGDVSVALNSRQKSGSGEAHPPPSPVSHHPLLSSGGHIPYRDSKLTRILQPSLGGNAKTAIICAMTPALCHAEESHSTLRFASRAKRVVNNAVVNEVLRGRKVAFWC